MDENEEKLFQNSVKYLHNISTLPEINVPTLKSFLCLKRRLMELRKNVFLPLNATKPDLHCQRCFLNYFDGPANYKVKSKLKKRKFVKKMLAKQRNGLALTTYQKEYLKKSNQFDGNHLVVTCKFCKYETDIKLNRPFKTNKKLKLDNLMETSTKKKKRKNKKDKFCGLNQSAVMSVSLNKSENINDSEIICLDSEETTPVKLRMKKRKEESLVTSTPEISLKVSNRFTEKKNKVHGKLTDILKNSSKKSKPCSSNLMQFLKDL